MKQYFSAMQSLGRAIEDFEIEGGMARNLEQIRDAERQIAAAKTAVGKAGIPADVIHGRGQKTGHERIALLLDDLQSFCPLNSLYDPYENVEGSTGVVTGIGAIARRLAVVIASDNKVLAGAWLPGQAEKIFRAQDIARQLRIPLVWLLNCSGVKLTEQQEVYASRRSGGRIFFRNAELAIEGIPSVVGVFGANPAGGGYHAISPTVIFAHKDASMAVGGGGIMSGLSPKGRFELEDAEQIIEATQQFAAAPPGGAAVHHDHTGCIKQVFDTEEGVINAIRDYIANTPGYGDLEVFRVDAPRPPVFAAEELSYLVPFNQRQGYEVEQVLARLFDHSEHMEFQAQDGPEVYCGLAKLDGFLVAVAANRQGFLPAGYPAYADYAGIGGKLYREGLLKLSTFVSLCNRDKLPMIWFQDTTGIDVGDEAEKAEVLPLGQSLIYSQEDAVIPMATVVLRKGCAATHYIMGGPQASRNVFTLGTPTTEIYVMHGETAAVASYARRLLKEKEAGKPLGDTIDEMNALVKKYYDESRPAYCARMGFVDEVVAFADIRKYLETFVRAAHQNPQHICPPHQMLLPRIIQR